MVCPGFKNSIVCCNSWEFPDVCCDCDRSSSYFITCQYSSTLGLIEKEFLTFLHLEMQKRHLTVKRRASLQILFSIDYGSIYYDAALSLESMQAFYWTYLVCLLLIIHPHHEHGLNFLSFLFFFFLNNICLLSGKFIVRFLTFWLVKRYIISVEFPRLPSALHLYLAE